MRVELWALALALPLGQITTLALPAVVPALREDLGLAYVELGLVIASFGIARLVMNLPAGELAQRFNPRTVLLASLAASLAASLLGQFATTAGMVTVSRLGQGAASAATQAVVLSWLLGGSPPAFRGRAMAISEASFSVFALAVPALTGLLATTTLSWRAAFLLGVLASLVGLAIVAFGTSAASASHAYGQVSGGAAAGRWRNLRAGGVLLLAACVSAFAVFYGRNGLVGSVLPLVAGEQLGLPSLSLGIALSVQAVVSTAAVMAGGWAADRVGRRRLLLPGLILLAVCQASVFLIRDEWTFLLITSLVGVSWLINALPPSLVGDSLPPDARARGIVLYRLVADSAWLVSPIVMGVALERGGFDAAKLAVLAPTVCIIGLLIVWRRPSPACT